MLPSLLVHDIQQGLRQFLLQGFEASDDFFHGLMRRFVEDQPGWMKGPYLQIGLPFRVGHSGREFFADFQTEYPGYTHQEAAWRRLSTRHEGAHTLVATGTGSGKTECFLYPLLDHAARERRARTPGIKALVIYPMNALATDQARRFAELIHKTPAFTGLRVGLFVGGGNKEPGEGMRMTPHGVITDRDTLRKAPPDILLTNYKMLDYLLIRPRDRALWAENSPENLRYVVVDELHTFDGAQGTDLALLLRRLRARLGSPEGHLIFTGTSATLGGNADTSPLRDYARQIFSGEFPPESVITENRLSVGEFLGEAPIDHLFQARVDLAEVLDPSRYPGPAAAVAAWFPVFFPDLPVPAEVDSDPWRQQLGRWLKTHLLFVNLLRLTKSDVTEVPEVAAQLLNALPEPARPHADAILNALLVLVAWARSPETPAMPLVTLRLQLWLRELRRMVARVSPVPELAQLRSSADLKSHPDGLHLPVIQCTQCRTTGWLSRIPHQASKVSQFLDEIYNTWFSGEAEAVRLYPGPVGSRPQVDGRLELLCGECGTLQASGESCMGCGSTELVRVFRTSGIRTSNRGGVNHAWHDNGCPACGERDRQILLGVRNATLGAQIVEQSWASPYNDDKKLIAFSDSVQDAAHRAGFFNARTYTRAVRTALAKALDTLGPAPLTWAAFLDLFADLWRDAASPLSMDAERFVTEFIGPNMVWQRDWAEEMLKGHGLPQKSRLPERALKRLCWQLQAEMTYLSRRGRTLERLGRVTLAPDTGQIDTAVESFGLRLREHYDAHGVPRESVFHLLWGFLAHLRLRGAVWHPELSLYAEDAELFALARTQGRGEWLPALSNYGPRPIFLSLGQHRGFDTLTATRGTTWYVAWLQATLGESMLLPPDAIMPLYRDAIQCLREAGLLHVTESRLGESVALEPTALSLHTRTRWLLTPGGRRRLTVPADQVDRLLGMPCLEAPALTYGEQQEPDATLLTQLGRADLRRVIAAEHTGLLEGAERTELEIRFKAKNPQPWYENVLSATPTLEMGVDIGDLSSVMLCSVPPSQASYLQRIGRAGRRDGNAVATTLADGGSAHDLYFYESTREMLAGDVLPPGVFLQAAEVLRRQLLAFCLDDWVATGIADKALPEKTSQVLNTVEKNDTSRFPYTFLDHLLIHEPTLFPAFLQLLGQDATPEIQERLRLYYQGDEDTDGLRIRLLKVFEELVQERKALKTRTKQLKSRIAALKEQPQDEATRHEIDQLDRERQSALSLIREIDHRQLLNTLTDAGLIPNYAFPEAGIELKSVLWRRRSSDDQTERAYVALPAFKYERSAASALSEFAPENRFYANQRRVEVDQINMDLASLEHWRFCPSCHHMQNLELNPVEHPACPHCGDVMWANLSQKRQLLRFRQAIANSDDTQVRIDDSAEDREPKFHVRQMLVDFDPKEVREAWRIPAEGLAFGFEFIARANFRDINFGELGKPGDTFQVADKEQSRPGFRLCRHCGKVQTPRRSKNPNEPARQSHTFDCIKRNDNDPSNLIDCLYLYREFQSEALRILVPYTKHGMDEDIVQSFIAALQLGLKRRFGGKVDHLRIMTQDEPGVDGGQRRMYVLLYDSVPGGTGYLHQLLSQDAQTLIDVLRLAVEVMTQCRCNDDPEKDGCYQCVYQYRMGRVMERVSRMQAVSVLNELLGGATQLEKVPTISDIAINAHFDSALEARFIQSLSRLSGINGLPRTRLVQEIVKGKTGYLLEVGPERYWIEPQVECPVNDGYAYASKPDFVLHPTQSKALRRPIAVFCDGWAYHRDTLQKDARKRDALVASGKFWVWSVTYDDVERALGKETQTDLESSLTRLNRHSQSSQVAADPGFLSLHAVAQLLKLLAMPGEAAETLLARNAAGITFRMIHPPQDQEGTAALTGSVNEFWRRLPVWMGDFDDKSSVWAASRDAAEPRVMLRWPQALASTSANSLCPGVILLPGTEATEEDQRQLVWRHGLALFNILQSLPGLLLATEQGLLEQDYDALQPKCLARSKGEQPLDDSSQKWNTVLEQALDTLHAGISQLAQASMPPPEEVGYELASDGRSVDAEAELAWIDRRVVVLAEHQFDYQPTWEGQGWRVVLATGDWTQKLMTLLQVAEEPR
jgi:DEAD/DEAH box helicase domain-containing protein